MYRVMLILFVLTCPLRAEAQMRLSHESMVSLTSDAEIFEPYRWIGSTYQPPKRLMRLSAKFSAPKGYSRVGLAPASFGFFLRNLPVLPGRVQVNSYAGARLFSPSAAIVAIDVGAKNLQQCADSIIRLNAEFLWSQGRGGDIAYHFTSGDLSTWLAWRGGERFRVKGAAVERVKGRAVANKHAQLRGYLEHMFRYAGTRSLRLDSTAVALEDAKPGDFFVAPGSPGHAVLILDIVESGSDRLALIGQGFMPAQEFHVVRSANHAYAVDDVWFRLPASDGKVHTPSWAAFEQGELRRFVD